MLSLFFVLSDFTFKFEDSIRKDIGIFHFRKISCFSNAKNGHLFINMKGEGVRQMRKFRQQLKNWVTHKMELPADVMMDLPRITMIGQIHIYIENHRGLLQFSDKELRLLLKQGQLLIKGEQFVLKTMLPEEILLEGKIAQVLYLDEPGK